MAAERMHSDAARPQPHAGGPLAVSAERLARIRLAGLERDLGWARFASEIALAGALLEEVRLSGPPDRIDGCRHLLGLLAMAIEHALVSGDPFRPVLARLQGPGRKWAVDNPDVLYLQAAIRQDCRYRISGRLGSACISSLQVCRGTASAGSFDLASLADPDTGEFSLTLGAPGSGSEVSLPGGVTHVLVRQFFSDWEKESAGAMWIERLGDVANPGEPGPEYMQAQLECISEFVTGSAGFWLERSLQARGKGTNRFNPPVSLADAGGDDALVYSECFFRLAPGQCLVIELPKPEARYWGVQLASVWHRSFDYLNHITSLNAQQVRMDADERIRLVVASRDEGWANWLNSCGRAEGWLVMRWYGSTRPPDRPFCELVAPESNLGSAPARGVVSAAERAADLHGRRQHLLRRFL